MSTLVGIVAIMAAIGAGFWWLDRRCQRRAAAQPPEGPLLLDVLHNGKRVPACGRCRELLDLKALGTNAGVTEYNGQRWILCIGCYRDLTQAQPATE